MRLERFNTKKHSTPETLSLDAAFPFKKKAMDINPTEPHKILSKNSLVTFFLELKYSGYGVQSIKKTNVPSVEERFDGIGWPF